MTDPVMEAKDRARATIGRWREARGGVNDQAAVPPRLDAIVAVADRAIATIGQDIVTEVEAVLVELTALQFPVDPDDALSRLEEATLSLDGALGRLSRVASRAGFAAADDDLGLPPGVRVPVREIAEQLEAFAAAVEGVRPVLERIAAAQAADRGTNNANQEAMIKNVIEKASVKIEIIGIKTGKVSLIDVSGLATLARQLTGLLRSFVATVTEATVKLSEWLARQAPDWIKPALGLIAAGSARLLARSAAWIRRKAASPPEPAQRPPEPDTGQLPAAGPAFDLLAVERMIERGEVPPAEVIPFMTSFYQYDLSTEALSALGHMTGLRKLELVLWSFRDLSPLAKLTALQSLTLKGSGIDILPPLAELTALQSLRLENTGVSDFSPLTGLTALRSLSLDDTQVSDLSPLAGLTALQTLNLDSTRVSDLSPLAGLTALQSLSLDNTQVSDLSPLAGLTALQTLSLDSTRVSDLSPLSGLTALQSLRLGSTQANDLSPLRDLPNLGQIVIQKSNKRTHSLGPSWTRDELGYRRKTD